MRILIIGGSGFIGSHVADAAIAQGHRVRVYDRTQGAFRQTPEGIEFVRGDFGDASAMAEAFTDIDVVFHLISTTVPTTANLDPIADIQGNLVNTVKLLEIMRAQRVRRLLYLSSGGTVYGVPTHNPVSESHRLMPISSYGIVKVAIEHYIRMESAQHGLDAVILRPSNPFGPRQGRGGVQGIIGTYMWSHACNEPLELWGDGSVVRDFLHVRDIAQLCVACAETGITGTFNAGAGKGRSIREIIDAISRVSGRPLAPIVKPARKFDVPRVVLDIAAIREAIGWTPAISFEDGLAETWAWVRDQVK